MRRTMLEPFYHEADTDPVNQVIHVYGRGWLAEDALTRLDRVSAAAGVVPLYPLLDDEVVDLCAKLPGGAKAKRYRGRHMGKWPLRSILSRHLPPQLVWRQVRRIAAPMDSLLRGDGEQFLLERTDALLEDPWGLFQANEVRRLVAEHLAGVEQNGLRLWTLIFFDAWRRSIGAR